jgi:hypothetical protein
MLLLIISQKNGVLRFSIKSTSCVVFYCVSEHLCTCINQKGNIWKSRKKNFYLCTDICSYNRLAKKKLHTERTKNVFIYSTMSGSRRWWMTRRRWWRPFVAFPFVLILLMMINNRSCRAFFKIKKNTLKIIS